MSSQWTNKYAIMRDLSMAQGCVPVDVDKTLSAGQKPPTPLICEETEEEFFKHCIGSGDFIAPDLGLIKQMLDLVRDVDITSDTEKDKTEIQISKLNPIAKEFVWKKREKTESSPDNDAKPAARKKEHKIRSIHNVRNVAVTSILEGFANGPSKNKENDPTVNSNDLTILLKSNQPQLSPNMVNSLQKVNNWLESNQKEKLKRTPLLMDPSTMFKKKANTSPPKEVKEVKEAVNVKSPPNVSMHYKPTSQAEEYYKKYLEKSQLKQAITEDIWTKAEREMKELDAKRKQEAEQSLVVSPCSIVTVSDTEFSDGSQLLASSDARMDVVKLPLHRHQLTGECVVCKVLCKKTHSDTVKIRKM